MKDAAKQINLPTILGWLVLAVGIVGTLWGLNLAVQAVKAHEPTAQIVLNLGHLIFKAALLATGFMMICHSLKAVWMALAALVGSFVVSIFLSPIHLILAGVYLHLLLFLFLAGYFYILRRLLYILPILFGVMVITFLLFRVVGGDISTEIAGKNALPETIAEIKHEYGWDKPLFVNVAEYKDRGVPGLFNSQFFDHLWNSATLDFGKSIRYKRSISDIVLEGAVPSLSITMPMFFIGLIASLSISLIVAYVRGTWLDRTLVIVCVLGMSMPYLSYILFAQYFFAYKLSWFPVFGYEEGWRKISYVALPILIGVISGLGASVRFYRTVILDEIHADYVRTARAKGASTTRVLFKHVLKNAMIPVLTQVVLAIPFLFLGSLLLERFFGIPGLGYLTVEAINARDYPIINAMTFIGALLYLLGLIATDLCYALVDPRVELR